MKGETRWSYRHDGLDSGGQRGTDEFRGRLRHRRQSYSRCRLPSVLLRHAFGPSLVSAQVMHILTENHLFSLETCVCSSRQVLPRDEHGAQPEYTGGISQIGGLMKSSPEGSGRCNGCVRSGFPPFHDRPQDTGHYRGFLPPLDG